MPATARTSHPELYSAYRGRSVEFKERRDCSVIAIAIACDVTYDEAHAALKAAGRKDHHPTMTDVSRKAISSLGFNARSWSWMERSEMIKSYPGNNRNLKNITSHHPRRFPQAWDNCHPNMIWRSPGHMFAVKNGIVMDWSINRSLQIREIWEIERKNDE